MNLYAKLRERAAQGKPLRLGLIGAGKFGTMYLAQVPKTPGVYLVGIADLTPTQACTNLARVGWSAERYAAGSLDTALTSGATHVSDDWQALVQHPQIDMMVEATGNMRPRAEGGQLHHKGQVEVVSSLERDGQPLPYDIRFGVWVGFEGDTEYIRRCFTEYGVRTDPTGRYACLYKRWHLIGLEVGISVTAIGVRHEPTGCPTGFRAAAVATAKRDLTPGEILDGEGGYTVVGRLMPAADSLRAGALPLNLAHGWKLAQPVAAGEVLRWKDVVVDAANSAVRVRREMEQMFAAPPEMVVT